MEELLTTIPPDENWREVDGALDRYNPTSGEAMQQAVQFVRVLGLLPRLAVGGAL